MIKTSKDQNIENQNIKKNIENHTNQTIDVLIFSDAIGKIRTSKVFPTKATFDVLVLPMASEKIRTSKV